MLCESDPTANAMICHSHSKFSKLTAKSTGHFKAKSLMLRFCFDAFHLLCNRCLEEAICMV